MTIRCFIAATLIAASCAVSAEAQPSADPRVADIVQAGVLRVGLGLGSPVLAVKDAKTGEIKGPALDLARALARKVGVELRLVEYPRPGAVLEGLRKNEWDVTFLVVDPARAAEVDFTPPYMQSDFTYLVPAGSPKKSAAEMDAPGVRIAVPRGDASDLRLSKMLKSAALVRADTIPAAIDMVRTGVAEAYAAPRALLMALAVQVPGSRVLDDGFDTLGWAAAVPKGKAAHLGYILDFLEDAKSDGLIKETMERAHLQGARVAPLTH